MTAPSLIKASTLDTSFTEETLMSSIILAEQTPRLTYIFLGKRTPKIL